MVTCHQKKGVWKHEQICYIQSDWEIYWFIWIVIHSFKCFEVLKFKYLITYFGPVSTFPEAKKKNLKELSCTEKHISKSVCWRPCTSLRYYVNTKPPFDCFTQPYLPISTMISC